MARFSLLEPDVARTWINAVLLTDLIPSPMTYHIPNLSTCSYKAFYYTSALERDQEM